MHINTLVALFDHYQNADRAVQALQNYGMDGNHISFVTRDEETIERSGTSTGKGAAADGLLGLLAGLSALSIPGLVL